MAGAWEGHYWFNGELITADVTNGRWWSSLTDVRGSDLRYPLL